MKEGINLATFHIPSSLAVSQPKGLHFFLSLSLGLFILATLLGNVGLWLLTVNEAASLKKLENRRRSLATEEETIRLLLRRQESLTFIKSIRKDVKQVVNLIKEKMPQDMTFSELTVSPGEVLIAARTPGGYSFSQFIRGLFDSPFFKEISLTRSVYDESSALFHFNLKCQITL